MTGALITHRDAIAGNWQKSAFTGIGHPIETPTNLRFWQPAVRASAIDFDLQSRLHFGKHTENYNLGTTAAPIMRLSNDCLTLWDLDPIDGVNGAAPTAPNPKRIMTMIRPTEAIFKDQARIVEQYAELREDRSAEIIAQLGYPIEFWTSVANLHPTRTPKTIEFLDAALRLALYVEMRFKHGLACRRPLEYSAQIQPVFLTPGHGALPSGHSTEAHMIARLLYALRSATLGASPLDEILKKQAARIATNRVIAGVHFPVDSAAGQVLGLTLAEYILHRCAQSAGAYASFTPWRFDGERYFTANAPVVDTADWFYTDHYANPVGFDRIPTYYADPLPSQSVAPSKLLNWLWIEATREW